MDVGLLLAAQVCKSCLHPGLSTKLLHTKLSGKVLLPGSETRLLVGKLCLHPRLLLCIELLLGVLKCRLLAGAVDVALKLSKITCGSSFSDRRAATTKRTTLNGSGSFLLGCKTGLAFSFPSLLVHHALHERVHVGFGGAGLGKALRLCSLGWPHLELLQVRAKACLRRSHFWSLILPALNPLSRTHLKLLEVRRLRRHHAKLAWLILGRGTKLIAEISWLIVCAKPHQARSGCQTSASAKLARRTHIEGGLLSPLLHGREARHTRGVIRLIGRVAQLLGLLQRLLSIRLGPVWQVSDLSGA